MTEQIKTQLELMNQQTKELASIYHNAAANARISDNEFWIWYALLALGGEYSQQDICEMWSLPKQTVNTIISNLLKKDLIALKPVPGSRNRKIIQPTPAGIEYGTAIILPVYHAELRALARLSEQERQTCLTLLGNYITLLKDECGDGDI